MFHQNIYFYFFGHLLNYLDGIEMIITYYQIHNYVDYVTVLFSFFVDTATCIRLAKFFRTQPEGWTRDKLWQEFFFLLQNIINVVIFAFSLIPYLLFIVVCENYDLRCYTTTWRRLIVILYIYNCRRVIWRMADEVVALIVQIRNHRRLKVHAETTATTTSRARANRK